MRPPQKMNRMRGRSNSNGHNNNNRRGPNPLTRSYESNGPDIKVRGTAAHVVEKYVQLARDAHVAGDPVAAENYLQHAEHYFRLIAAAQLALNPAPRIEGAVETNDEGNDEDFDGGINDRFTYRPPQSYQAPVAGQAFNSEGTEEGATAAEQPVSSEQTSMDAPFEHRPTEPRYQQEPRYQPRNDSPRNEVRNEGRNSNPRFEGRPTRDRNERPQRNDFNRNDSSRHESRNSESRFENRNFENGTQENNRQENNRFEAPRRDRNFRPEKNYNERSFEPRNIEPRAERSFNENPIRERTRRTFEPDIADVQPILPSFITTPIAATRPIEPRQVETRPVEVSAPHVQPELVLNDEAAPKVRRRRAVKSVVPAAD